ncbi:MAG: leucine--tRNA ligase, partial [Thermoproteota archaeon]
PDQWFLNYGDPTWKSLAWECLNSMRIVPGKYRKLFEDTFEWLEMRPVARKRGLGTPLPFDREWVIESLSDSTIYMAFYTIAHIIKGEGIRAEQLKPELFDYVFLGRGDADEVSRITGIERGVIERMRREFEYWYPNDHRHTAIGHITNHLSFFVFHHAIIFPRELWPRMITLNEYVIREGAKMSKSRGNVLPLVEIPRRYSADLFRLYVVSTASLDTAVDWREEQVRVVLGRMRAFWNKALEIIEASRGVREPGELSLASRWALSRLNTMVREATEHLESMRLREYAVLAFYEILNLVSRYESMAAEVDGDERRWTLRRILEVWVRLLAPLIPHMAEELWERMGMEGFVSVAAWPEADEGMIDRELEAAVEAVERTVEDIKEIVAATSGKYSRAYIYVGPEDWAYEVLRIASGDGSRGVKEVLREAMSRPEIRGHGKRVVGLVQAIFEGRVPRTPVGREVELRTFRELRGYISRRVGMEVVVEEATNPSYDPAGKSRAALPLKPGIYLE